MTDQHTSAVDEREATFRRWLRAAGRCDVNAWTPTLSLYAAWHAFAGERPGSVGSFCARMRAAGVEAHRTNAQKGFRFKLTDINEIAAAITAATSMRERARRDGDATALAAAVRAQKEAQRRAGALLDAGMALASVFKITDGQALRWQALSRLGDQQFNGKIADSTARAIAAMEHGGVISLQQPKMTITAWRRDENGVLSRELRAEGVKPTLKGEGFDSRADRGRRDEGEETVAPGDRFSGRP